MCLIYNIKTVDDKDIDFMFENAERDEVGDTSCAAFIQEYRAQLYRPPIEITMAAEKQDHERH
jgi:hypothetical protein